ncbi:MAG TPA: carbonic anhydrase [Gemmatimonadales bacterium]|jgi:carbonic anhydrase|nr:carbonic anhydrase [Gemmatimonadales bacterium]
MAVIDELVVANKRFSGARQAVQLPMPPARKVAVVTCMDARILPGRVLGLEEGDAHVIRNAGGRAKDALRSLVISQRLLGTQEVAVIHHTDCGMLTFSNDDLRRKIRDDLHTDAADIDFLPFPEVEQSVRDDVKFLKDSPLIPDAVPIRGFVYDVRTGALTEVKA